MGLGGGGLGAPPPLIRRGHSHSNLLPSAQWAHGRPLHGDTPQSHTAQGPVRGMPPGITALVPGPWGGLAPGGQAGMDQQAQRGGGVHSAPLPGPPPPPKGSMDGPPKILPRRTPRPRTQTSAKKKMKLGCLEAARRGGGGGTSCAMCLGGETLLHRFQSSKTLFAPSAPKFTIIDGWCQAPFPNPLPPVSGALWTPPPPLNTPPSPGRPSTGCRGRRPRAPHHRGHQHQHHGTRYTPVPPPHPPAHTARGRAVECPDTCGGGGGIGAVRTRATWSCPLHGCSPSLQPARGPHHHAWGPAHRSPTQGGRPGMC